MQAGEITTTDGGGSLYQAGRIITRGRHSEGGRAVVFYTRRGGSRAKRENCFTLQKNKQRAGAVCV